MQNSRCSQDTDHTVLGNGGNKEHLLRSRGMRYLYVKRYHLGIRGTM